MFDNVKETYLKELEEIRTAGLFKEERIILTDQKPSINVRFPENAQPKEVLNFCANNYLGLANNPELIKAAQNTLEHYGFGLSSVRFICGTQDLHKNLEKKIAEFHETEDAILYSSCFDANGGLFETVLGKEDAIVTDSLNHASIIDGIRLCRAKRFIYEHGDMNSLEEKLRQAVKGDGSWGPARRIMIATDGIFSMDGDVAKLQDIVALSEKYQAMVMVDESHATGFFGASGRGAVEHCNVMGKVDIITSTLGKALGGASGGFTTGRKAIIDMLRQKSRPYLFSNTLAPSIAGAALATFEMLEKGDGLREKLRSNTRYFRTEMEKMGFDIIPGIHPIVPVMFRKFEDDAKLAQAFARDLYNAGIYAVGFFFPVVPRGQARIRVQISAAHTEEHISLALAAFKKVGLKHKVI